MMILRRLTANLKAQNWTLTFGGDQMRDIDDQQIRRNLAVVLTA